jgi:hypothetical protein
MVLFYSFQRFHIKYMETINNFESLNTLIVIMAILKMFKIIIPLYNASKYIRNSIDNSTVFI